jgi:hypothetical protein
VPVVPAVVFVVVVVVLVLVLLDPHPAARASAEQASTTDTDLGPLFINILSRCGSPPSLAERQTAVGENCT